MAKVELLAVGRELLIGKTVDTNANWMGGRLARMGSRLARITTIDDDLKEISSSIRDSLGRGSDFVVVVGGLGPTPDDMTLRGVAGGLRGKLTLNREAMLMVKQHYRKIGGGNLELTQARKKMMFLPKGATPLRNLLGTAPGVRLKSGSTVIFCLPGVPREMKFIFKDSVEGEIREKVGRLFSSRIIMNLEGIYESTLAPIIEETVKRYPNTYVKSHPKGVEEGVSKIELDIVRVTKTERGTDLVAEIAASMRQKIMRAGGRVAAIKTSSNWRRR